MRELVGRLTRAFEASDVDGIVALLAEDVRMAMPPIPLEYRGRDRAAQFLTTVFLAQGASPRLIATRANGQPAFGLYVRDPRARVLHTMGLLAVTLAGNRIGAITRFDASVLPHFGLPEPCPTDAGHHSSAGRTGRQLIWSTNESGCSAPISFGPITSLT